MPWRLVLFPIRELRGFGRQILVQQKSDKSIKYSFMHLAIFLTCGFTNLCHSWSLLVTSLLQFTIGWNFKHANGCNYPVEYSVWKCSHLWPQIFFYMKQSCSLLNLRFQIVTNTLEWSFKQSPGSAVDVKEVTQVFTDWHQRSVYKSIAIFVSLIQNGCRSPASL